MKLGFIGVGQMASAIITALADTNQHDILISNSSWEKSQQKALELGVVAAKSHEALIKQSDLIILGIKPQSLEDLLAGLDINKPLISMLAGVTLAQLEKLTSPTLPICRIMPNLHAKNKQSVTALCANPAVSQELLEHTRDLVKTFGSCFNIKETDFPIFTALAGSSPAYMAFIIEAMAKAGVKHGLPKDLAVQLVTQTMMATSQYLAETSETPASFMDKVASPGGLTIAGLLDLEKTGLTASIVSAIDATVERDQELQQKN